MKKGERLEISVSMIATRDVEDEQVDAIAFSAMARARDMLLSNPFFRRLSSGISIGPAIQSHRRFRVRVRRRGRCGAEHDDLGICSLTIGHHGDHRSRHGRWARTETPSAGTGKPN